jgi:hypothetical protein
MNYGRSRTSEVLVAAQSESPTNVFLSLITSALLTTTSALLMIINALLMEGGRGEAVGWLGTERSIP